MSGTIKPTITCEAVEVASDSAGAGVEAIVEHVGGRLTRELAGSFCARVAQGHRRTVACDALRIPWSTYRHWQQVGQLQIRRWEAGEIASLGVEGQFVLDIAAAEASFHMAAVSSILASEDPVVILRYLKARFPKLYHHDGRQIVDDDAAEVVSTENPEAVILARVLQLKRSADG